MLKLSKKVEYAMAALVHMGKIREDDFAGRREISEAYGIPSDLLGKILQLLKKGGLVKSEQGVKGGYRLAKPLKWIRIGDVIKAVENNTDAPTCAHGIPNCIRGEVCKIRPLVMNFHTRLQTLIHSITLDDL